jgi:hypothetical protein
VTERHEVENDPAEKSERQEDEFNGEENDSLNVSGDIDESTQTEIGAEVWPSKKDVKDLQEETEVDPLAPAINLPRAYPEQQDVDYNGQASTGEIVDLFDETEYQYEGNDDYINIYDQEINPLQHENDFNTADLIVGANEFAYTEPEDPNPLKKTESEEEIQRQIPGSVRPLEHAPSKRGRDSESIEGDDEEQGMFSSFLYYFSMLLPRPALIFP